jgi:hypothetical protein
MRTIWTMMLGLALAGCSNSSDTDNDTDTDTDVEPLVDLRVLLAEIPEDTHWADLVPELQEALAAHAEAKYAVYRAEWGAAGFASKEAEILGAATGPIHDNLDLYVAAVFGSYGIASIDDLDPALGTAIRRLYLAHVGTVRNGMVWNGWLTTDWDGTTPLEEMPLPDGDSLLAAQEYADSLADTLDALIASGTLNADQTRVAELARYWARSLRTGSLAMTGYGGDDLLTPANLASWGPSPTYDYAFIGAFEGDPEAFLRHQNAMWFNDDLKYVSAPMVAEVTEFSGPSFAANPDEYAAVLTDPDLAREAWLMAQWWVDRLVDLPGADAVCRPYTAEERLRLEDALTADMMIPETPGFFQAFDTTLDIEGAALTASYQVMVLDAVEALFGRAERDAVAPAVFAETRFGQLLETTKRELTDLGRPQDADALQAALDAVPTVGGYDTSATEVTPEDAAVVAEVWANVRGALVAQYSTGNRLFDIDANLPQTVAVDLGYSTFTVSPGDIVVGVGVPVSIPMLYVILTHEALHAFDQRSGLNPQGSSIEGAATLVEQQVGKPMVAAFAPEDQAALWGLVGMANDTRRYGLSDATLAVLLTECPAGTDSTTLAVDAASAWGMSGSALDEVPARSHWGTQFLSYLAGQYQVLVAVTWFEDRVDPASDDGIDPFDLHTCGLDSPALTEQEVAELSVCLGALL